MTVPDDLEDVLEALEQQFPIPPEELDDVPLTKQQQLLLDSLDEDFPDPDADVSEETRIHRENVRQWVEEEGMTYDGEPHAPGEAINGGLTEAGMTMMDMWSGEPRPLLPAYYERFPDAPRGSGEDTHRPQNGARYGGMGSR